MRLERFLVSRAEGFCGLQNQQKAVHDYNQYDGDGGDGDDGDDGDDDKYDGDGCDGDGAQMGIME